jgi:D-glycero-D-manno-heptose 1,7-bisphosphate phosphatase
MTREGEASARGRAVFFDRDGVVNKIILRDGKPFSPRTIEEFVLTEGIRETVSSLKKRGYKTILISNQPEVARGRITLDTLDQMMQRVQREVGLDDLFICLHDDDDRCACRKPEPGMILEASRKWKIDLRASFVIGDTWKDMEAGKAAGCKTILLDAVYNRDVRSDFRVTSLAEAAELILE